MLSRSMGIQKSHTIMLLAAFAKKKISSPVGKKIHLFQKILICQKKKKRCFRMQKLGTHPLTSTTYRNGK